MQSKSQDNWISNNPFGIVMGLVLGVLGCVTAIDPPVNGRVGLIALYILGILGFATLMFSSAFFQVGWPLPHILLLVLIGFFAGYVFDYFMVKLKLKRFLTLLVVCAVLNTLAVHILISLISTLE